MYDRVLVPVAGPPTDDPAIEKGIELARRHDASITAVHVVRTERIASVSMESAWPGVVAMARREGETIVDATNEYLVDAGVSVDTVLREGSPSREIVNVARRRECDLIVMATSGRVGLNRLLLGSVTERVVRQSPVPVLTVRRPSKATTDESVVDANVTP